MLEFYNGTLKQYRNFVEGKKVFLFGASKLFSYYVTEQRNHELCDNIYAVIDNDLSKKDSIYHVGTNKWLIHDNEFMKNEIDHNSVILIATRFYVDIVEQLEKEIKYNGIACFILPFMNIPILPKRIEKSSLGELIPRKIHYCWFGKGKKSALGEACINSWKKNCPDYEIIEWNEDNYDIDKYRYVKQAYENKQWAFVSDVARLDIIYEHGGIYVDTDVEILRNIDELLCQKAFMAFHGKQVNTGLGFGAVKGLPIMKILLDDYVKREFVKSDGSFDKTICPVIQTSTLEKMGLIANGEFQQVGDLVVYPDDYFAGIIGKYGRNIPTAWGYMHHHFEGTWNKQNVVRVNKIIKRNEEFGQRFKSLCHYAGL